MKSSNRTREARERLGMPQKDTSDWGTKASPKTVFTWSIAAMALFPVGAVLALLGDTQGGPLAIIGYLVIAAALLSMVPVFSSRLYKIASEEKVKRDEFEQQLRYRSVTRAYTVLTAIVAMFLLWFSLAPDWNGWVPQVQDHFDGLFWGFILYAMMLPPAFLSYALLKAEREN